MNKQELIKEVSVKAEISKKEAEVAVEAVLDVIGETLASGEAVKLVNFGNFEVKKRAARKGRNPQTGEEIDIAESRVPAFKAAKGLKDKVNA
jgi:DNA-binding protein HU-beta